ncbi:MAG: glycogen debranching enzyme family protein [Ktedonobacteraceae bacterium]|nr:glycogen debranching enzyme family protein [Ktedonobacteraceae bacterium]
MVLEKHVNINDPLLAHAWNMRVERDICADVQAGLDHEWLVTNGLGGYAAGSLVGATTRSYHGLLVAALRPPVGRTVLVSKVDEEITMPEGQVLRLGTNEYVGGVIEPQGYTYLESVSLEGDIPCFTYRLGGTLTLDKRIWMEYGQNTTFVQYTLNGIIGDEENQEGEEEKTALELTLFPFCLARDHHSSTQGAADWHFLVESQGNRCLVRAFNEAPPCWLIAPPQAVFQPTGIWYWRVFHRRERERGLPDCEDVYQPGIFRLRIAPGMRVTLVISAERNLSPELGGERHEESVAQVWRRRQRRIKQLLSATDRSSDNLQRDDPVLARLVVAADQFIVARPDYAADAATANGPVRLTPDRKAIIAGYPWFTSWGRDSMISLPGLLLAAGRYGEARGLLKTVASFSRNGLIPNYIPENGDTPAYNTADATLWMFYALNRYLLASGDWSLLKELFPLLAESIQWHVRGTLYGIGVDPRDGLLQAGVPGMQLTWMDARVGDQVMTPRRGKPVEINALWYHALSLMELWAVRLCTDAGLYSQLRTQVKQHFAARFWYDEGGYLYDVVDVDGVSGKNDASLRPNQLFAASLAHDLLSEAQTVSMFERVTEHLLTPAGLRSLSPQDPAYCAHFQGNPLQRDSAYHQGTVWQWLIGPYVDVYLRVRNNRAALASLLEPLVKQLWGPCLGTISEVAEPEPPFSPAGCFAQAWSVAELLRCWLVMKG